MKFLLILSVTIAATAASVIKTQSQGSEDENRYFYFAGDDGAMSIVDAEEPVDTAFIEEYTRNPNNNRYWLFTRANPTSHQVLTFGNAQSIRNSNYDSGKTTVFLAHGWNGDGGNGMNRLLTEAFLGRSDVNVIVLDWSALANTGYTTAKGGTAAVGRGLGQFVNWLVSNGFSAYNRIHLVGFSLGGHLVGNAGRETRGAVARVTALDPAGPLWSGDSNRIVRSDARYVEVIHTDIDLLGYSNPCGDADFYPNGGANQPGCRLNSCSHSRAYEFMASSVRYNHLQANECASMMEATRNTCRGSLFPMGNSDLNKFRQGIFRGNTGNRYPF